jgi:hypothetical protein
LRQTDAIAIPERELPADKIRIIEDGIKPCRFCIGRVLVALREEERAAKAQVVFINGCLYGSHVRFDTRASPRNRIAVVAPEGVVVSVRKIQSTDVAVACDAQITDLNRMGARIADERGPDQKAVAVVFNAAPVVVVMQASL